MVEFFKGLSFFFLPLGFGPKRIDFFEKQIRKFGGNLDEDKSKITHVVIEESTCEKKGNCSSALRSRGFCFSREKVKYVRVTWLSECLSRKILIDTKPYELKWIEEEFLSDDVEGEEKRKRQSVIEDVYDDSLEKRQKVDYEVRATKSIIESGEPL